MSEFRIGASYYPEWWPGANWSVDCFEATKYLDFAAWDNYVPQPNGNNYRVQLRASMEHSFCRKLSNGKNKFLVAEQSSGVGANGLPEVIRAQTWLNVSHGAFATIFFEWRTPIGGSEQAYESVLGRDRIYNECEHVFRKLTSELGNFYHLIDGAVTVSDIAAVYSHENSWAINGWTVDGFYDEEFFNAYSGMKNILGRDIDVISMTDDLEPYKIVIAPNLKMISPTQAQRYKKYVDDGGILVINTECGTRDENNLIYEMLEPGLFADIAGVKVVARSYASTIASQIGESFGLEFNNGKIVELKNDVYKLRADTAKTIAKYTGGKLVDTPAITINSYGKGYCITSAVNGNDIYFYEALAGYIRDEFDINPIIKYDDGIILSTREKDGKKYIIAVNMKESEASIYLNKICYDIIGATQISGGIAISGYDILFIQVL